ncbi:MAG: ATP-binding protein [Planctomycetota bacterium]
MPELNNRRAGLGWGLWSRLVRGESDVASAGLTVAAVLLAAMGASAWWVVRAQHEAVDAARREQTRTLAQLVAQTAQGMMTGESAGANPELRSLVINTAVINGLDRCRIRLSDGTVIADSLARAEAGSGGGPASVGVPSQVERVEIVEGRILAAAPIALATGGAKGVLGATVEIEATPLTTMSTDGTAERGIGAIGAVGMVGMLLAYRGMRKRLRALGAIREALRAASAGEASSGALAVGATMGPEAKAWNELLAWRDKTRVEQLLGQVAERRTLSGRETGGTHGTEALDSLWQGVLLLDDRMNIAYANGAAAVCLKTRREELIGKGFAETVGGPEALSASEAIRTGSVKHRVNFELSRSSDGKPVVASAGSPAASLLRVGMKPARKGDGMTAIVVIEDATQQRVADQSRNALVAQASHELRTPLTNIRLYAEALLDDGGENPASRQTAINVINQESRRLERIVADMLSVSEIEAGSFKLRHDDVSIGAVMEELRNDFAPQAADKEITLLFDLPPKMPTLHADRDKITMAIQNLVGNALKYTPAGGTVKVRVSDVSPGTPSERLVVEVSDTGIGVKEEEHELIFDRFYRAKDRRISGITGTGLGLTLSRQIARAHGGDVTVNSQIDKGSTFVLTVPIGESVVAGMRAA